MEQILLVKGYVSTIQIDISDGRFTKNTTWPLLNTEDKDFTKIIREEEPFPFSEEIEFEVHLMVGRPDLYIQNWISAGAKRIIVHFESFSGIDKAVEFAEDFKSKYGSTGYASVEQGLALNMSTSLDIVADLKEQIDFVQLMSIDKLGFHGAVYNPSVLERIAEIRSRFSDLVISVDGGISLENAKDIIYAGATRLIVGGAIFQSEDIAGTIKQLQALTANS